ncbi:hypothetical protein [Ferruginibacter sp.]
MKTILLLLLTLNCFTSKGQVGFNKKYFENTAWASKNSDSLFFKADTITIIKTTGRLNSPGMKEYFKNSNFVTFNPGKAGRMKFFMHYEHERVTITLIGTYKWNFDKASQVLNLFYNDVSIGCFVAISETATVIPSVSIGVPDLKTTAVLLKRVNETGSK